MWNAPQPIKINIIHKEMEYSVLQHTVLQMTPSITELDTYYSMSMSVWVMFIYTENQK